jgi:hypothetical protein
MANSRSSFALWLGAGTLAFLTVSNAHAQNIAPATHNVATLGTAPAVPTWSAPPPQMVSPGVTYGVGNPWGNTYMGAGWGNSANGYLTGLANLTSATGQYQMNNQQARMMRAQANSATITTRQQMIQAEADYERSLPTALDDARFTRKTDLEWARNFPQNTRIWSGEALNTLMNSAVRSGRLSVGPNISLDPDILQRINLKDVSSVGNVGLVRNSTKLKWPMSLKEPQFDKDRKSFTENLNASMQQLSSEDGLQPKTFRALEASLKSLNGELDASVQEMSPNDWMTGRRYLNQLREVVRGLADPNAATNFDRGWAKNINSVKELLTYMTDKGKVFAAAALPSDNSAYSSLYQSLRAFEMQVAGPSGR